MVILDDYTWRKLRTTTSSCSLRRIFESRRISIFFISLAVGQAGSDGWHCLPIANSLQPLKKTLLAKRRMGSFLLSSSRLQKSFLFWSFGNIRRRDYGLMGWHVIPQLRLTLASLKHKWPGMNLFWSFFAWRSRLQEPIWVAWFFKSLQVVTIKWFKPYPTKQLHF